MIFVEEYKGFKIYLDAKRGKFFAQKEDEEINIEEEELKKLKKKIDSRTFRREKGFAYIPWMDKIFECEKTSEITKRFGGKYYRVSFEENGRKIWREAKRFVPYSEEKAKLVEEFNKRVDMIKELERENVELLKKIFEREK